MTPHATPHPSLQGPPHVATAHYCVSTTETKAESGPVSQQMYAYSPYHYHTNPQYLLNNLLHISQDTPHATSQDTPHATPQATAKCKAVTPYQQTPGKFGSLNFPAMQQAQNPGKMPHHTRKMPNAHDLPQYVTKPLPTHDA